MSHTLQLPTVDAALSAPSPLPSGSHPDGGSDAGSGGMRLEITASANTPSAAAASASASVSAAGSAPGAAMPSSSPAASPIGGGSDAMLLTPSAITGAGMSARSPAARAALADAARVLQMHAQQVVGQTAKLQACINNMKQHANGSSSSSSAPAAPRPSPIVQPISVPVVDEVSGVRSGASSASSTRRSTRAFQAPLDTPGSGGTAGSDSTHSPLIDQHDRPAKNAAAMEVERDSAAIFANQLDARGAALQLALSTPMSPDDLARYAVPSTVTLPKIKLKARSATSSPLGGATGSGVGLLSSSGEEGDDDGTYSDEDIGNDIISDSDLTEIAPALGGNITTVPPSEQLAQMVKKRGQKGKRTTAGSVGGVDGFWIGTGVTSRRSHSMGHVPHVMAIHSECRPIRLQEDGPSTLKSFDAFKHVLQAQGLAEAVATAATNTSGVGAAAATTAGKPKTKDVAWLNGSPSELAPSDLSTRHTLVYTHSSKTPNRLSSGALEHQTARRLKTQKHHRRHSSLVQREDGSSYFKAHPLVEPLHPIEKQQLASLVARKRGSGTVLHTSPTIDRAMYDDVCHMLARTNRLLSEREDDLKLAGQIGEAILAENSKLEALVAELSTNLQTQLDEAEQAAQTQAQLQQKVDELTAINKALLEQQHHPSADSHSNNNNHSGIIMLTSPAGMGAQRHAPSPSSSSSSASPASAFASPSRLVSMPLSRDASELGPMAQVSSSLAEFLREELETPHISHPPAGGGGGGAGELCAIAGGVRLSCITERDGNNASMIGSSPIGLAAMHLQQQHQRHHSRNYSSSSSSSSDSFPVYLPSPASAVGAQFSSSPSSKRALSSAFAMSVPPEKLLEDLASVARKLKRERRVNELEKANWAQALESMERELRAKQSWVEAHQAEVDAALVVRKEKEELAAQLVVAAQKAQEASLAASVETKLKLQQQKRQTEVQIEHMEEELRAEREESARTVAARNEVAVQCEQLHQQIEMLQAQLKAAQVAANEQKANVQAVLQAKLEAQALSQSHEQLAALTAQLKEELEKTVAEDGATIAARDATIAALEEHRARLDVEVAQLREQLERAEVQATAMTAQHIEQLASVSSGFERRLAEEKARAAEQTERLLAEQRQSIEEQVEHSRLEAEKSLREQAEAFLASQRTVKLLAEEADLGREELVFRAIELSPASGAAAAALASAKSSFGKNVKLEGAVPPNPDEDKVVHENDNHADRDKAEASESDKLAAETVSSLTSPVSSNGSATSASGSSSSSVSGCSSSSLVDSMMSPMSPSCSPTTSRASSSSPTIPASSGFNITLPQLQLKFPPTPASALSVRGSASKVESSPQSVRDSSAMTAPFIISMPIIVTIAPSTDNEQQQPRASPASRAIPMSSPLVGAANLASQTSTVAFAGTAISVSPHGLSREHQHNQPRDFHAALSSPLPPMHHAGASSPLPPRASPSANASDADKKKKSSSLLESANQHRLALLSSVGKALSIVTGITPTHSRAGNTPPNGVGATSQAHLVAAALSNAMTPQQVRAPPARAAAVPLSLSPSPHAAPGSAGSIYVLPMPSFPVSASDQLSLAYLYRYIYAMWVQAFEWLDSNVGAKPALWIEDRVSGHCFSCQKHWTVVSRRHHCRLCGALFCGTCSRFRVDMPSLGIDDPVRVCLRCFGAAQSMSMSNSLALWETPGTMQPPPEKLLGVFPSPQAIRRDKDDDHERKAQLQDPLASQALAPQEIDEFKEESLLSPVVELVVTPSVAAVNGAAGVSASASAVRSHAAELSARRKAHRSSGASRVAGTFDLDSEDDSEDDDDLTDSEAEDDVDDESVQRAKRAALAAAAATMDSSADEGEGGSDSDDEFARESRVVLKNEAARI